MLCHNSNMTLGILFNIRHKLYTINQHTYKLEYSNYVAKHCCIGLYLYTEFPDRRFADIVDIG